MKHSEHRTISEDAISNASRHSSTHYKGICKTAKCIKPTKGVMRTIWFFSTLTPISHVASPRDINSTTATPEKCWIHETHAKRIAMLNRLWFKWSVKYLKYHFITLMMFRLTPRYDVFDASPSLPSLNRHISIFTPSDHHIISRRFNSRENVNAITSHFKLQIDCLASSVE